MCSGVSGGCTVYGKLCRFPQQLLKAAGLRSHYHIDRERFQILFAPHIVQIWLWLLLWSLARIFRVGCMWLHLSFVAERRDKRRCNISCVTEEILYSALKYICRAQTVHATVLTRWHNTAHWILHHVYQIKRPDLNQ